jgi:peptidoglycan hydrolase-like protein with peptidoglycan-binding domain
MNKITLSQGLITKNEVTDLHTAFRKMKIRIDSREQNEKQIGETTLAAIKTVQHKYRLPVNGELDERTLQVLNRELTDAFVTLNKTRTEKLQGMLEKMGFAIDAGEKKNRTTGDTTRKAIAAFQQQYNLKEGQTVTDEMMSRLENEVITKNYTTKTQITNLHSTLGRVLNIAKLGVKIPEDEIRQKEIGPGTSKAISSFQEKYKLPVTGKLDKATMDRLDSVSASRGYKVAALKQEDANALSVVKTNLRMNMVTPKVNGMQKALAHLGFKIDEKEFKTQVFGKTTREAVVAFQKSKGLPVTGNFEGNTLKLLNNAILGVNPKALAAIEQKYRIRGSVRDDLWERKGNMVLRIFEKTLDGDSAQPLMTKKTHNNGFFDIVYTQPVDKLTKKPK